MIRYIYKKIFCTRCFGGRGSSLPERTRSGFRSPHLSCWDWDGRSGQLFFMLFRDIYPRVLVRETICLLWYASFPVPRPCNSLAHHLVTGATNGHGLKCDAWGDSKARSPSIYDATCWAKMSPTGAGAGLLIRCLVCWPRGRRETKATLADSY